MRNFLLICLLTISTINLYGQNLSLYEAFLGKYDFTMIGNTMNLVPNGTGASCIIGTSSSANLNLPVTQTVEKAYLYWAGSGSASQFDFDIRLNMEMYKSFTYSVMPFALAFAAMIILKDNSQEITDVILNKKSGDFILGGLFGMFVGVMISVGFITEWWVNYFYGKYAKEIRKVIDELKE